MKKYLNNASIFLLLWELLKNAIIESIASFMTNEYRDGKWIESEEYKRDVLSLDPKNRFRASCLWSVSEGIISTEDADEIERLNNERNNITHRLSDILYQDEKNIKNEDILLLNNLISKVDKWWFINVEAQIDPDLMDKDDIDIEGVMSGRMIVTGYIINKHLYT